MNEFFDAGRNFVNHLIDSVWASLPEQTAADLANCKKDVLNGVKKAVNVVIDEEVMWTDRHLDNARRMREQYQRKSSSDTASDVPPVSPA